MAGDKVRLYFVTPPAVVYKWEGILPSNGIAGLEEGLIRELRPSWNRQGNKGIRSWKTRKRTHCPCDNSDIDGQTTYTVATARQ